MVGICEEDEAFALPELEPDLDLLPPRVAMKLTIFLLELGEPFQLYLLTSFLIKYVIFLYLGWLEFSI